MTRTLHGRELVTYASLLVLGCNQAREPSPSARTSTRAAAPSAAPPAAPATPAVLDPRTRGWELGQRYDYDLKSTTRITFGSGPSSYDFDLTGKAELVPVVVSKEEATLHVS